MTMTARKKSARPSLTTPEAQPAEAAPLLTRQFEAVFIAHWPRVYGFLLRLVGDHAEAEDLALETFLRLYRQPPPEAPDLAATNMASPGEPADPIGGWLRRVATNLGLNAIRGWKRRQHYELEVGGSDLRQRLQRGQESNPAELFQAEEERQRVRRILSEMNPRQSRLLVMRHSGLPYREIAAELGVAATSIGPLLARAEVDFERRYRAAYLDDL